MDLVVFDPASRIIYTKFSVSQRCCAFADELESRPLVCRVSSSPNSAQVSKYTYTVMTDTYQLLENALVQPPLFRPAVPELLVVVLKALPVGSELRETVLVDVFDTGVIVSFVPSSPHLLMLRTR
jgi:hypothetical protein